MKVALINFSPKGNKSNSAFFLSQLKDFFSKDVITEHISVANSLREPDYKSLEKCEAWVFFYPLYVDSLPSHMLSFLEKASGFCKGKRIYAVANCGFFEGEQTRLSFEIINNWCVRYGTLWCGGVGIGASGCFEFFEKFSIETGPRIRVDRALEFLAKNIEQGSSQCNNYATVIMPKRFYKVAGQILWRQKLIKNGVKIKDISRRVE